MKIDSTFEIGSNFASKATILILLKKVLGSLSGAWQLCMLATPPLLLAENSWILGLSNQVRHISDFLIVFTKIAKNGIKIASKNNGVWKLNFPSVI